MKNKRWLPALLCLLGLSAPSYATVFWEEGFENHLYPNWEYSSYGPGCVSVDHPDGCNPGISADIAHTGTHSLKSDYPNSDFTQAGSYMNRYHTSTADVWVRVYYYTMAFQYHPNAETKHWYHKKFPTSDPGDEGAGDFIISHWWGNRQFAMDSETQVKAPAPCTNLEPQTDWDSCNYYFNMADRPINDGKWYCIETHVKENSAPDLSDGMLEMWVDGAQTLGYYNRKFHSDTGTASPIGRFSLITLYAQGGYGKMYYDDLAIGDSRIGCMGAPGPDALSPARPRNLRTQ